MIEGDGKTAEVTSYHGVIRVGEAPRAGFILTGVDWDRLVKLEGRWLSAERRLGWDPLPEHRGLGPPDVLVLRRDKSARAS